VLCRIVYDYEDYGLSMAAMRFVNSYGPKSGFADVKLTYQVTRLEPFDEFAT
jgi:hypothetical protein